MSFTLLSSEFMRIMGQFLSNQWFEMKGYSLWMLYEICQNIQCLQNPWSSSIKTKGACRILGEIHHLSYLPRFRPTQTFSECRLCVPRRQAVYVLYLASPVPWDLYTWPRPLQSFLKGLLDWTGGLWSGNKGGVWLGGCPPQMQGFCPLGAPSHMTRRKFGEGGVKTWSLGASLLPNPFSLQPPFQECFTSGCQWGSPNQDFL